MSIFSGGVLSGGTRADMPAGGVKEEGSVSSGGSSSGEAGAPSGGNNAGGGGSAASAGESSADGNADSPGTTMDVNTEGGSASTDVGGDATSVDAGAAGVDGSAASTGIQPDGAFATICPSLFETNTGAPPGVAPLPSPEQASYQHTELTAMLTFSLATFNGSEPGAPVEEEATAFAPTNLTQDTVNAWVSELKTAGFRQAMLTVKQYVGFCLWPSKLTNDCNQFSVAESGWAEGRSGGDLVKMWTDAMRYADMRVGIYLSPWDQHYPSSSNGYQTYMENQLIELLTDYGPVYQVELDGANATEATVDWSGFFTLARKLQPHVLIWAGPEVSQMAAAANPPNFPDVQWIGNQVGQASRTTSSLNLSNCAATSDGTIVGEDLWCPYEAPVSDRLTEWFWTPEATPMTLREMQSIYFTSVGMNSTLLFGVPPSTTGAFDPKDATLLQEFGTWYASLYANNTLKGQPAVADSTWETAGFDGSKAVDEDICTYWAAAGGKTTGRLEVDPPSSITFSVISIREPIELGERSTGYHVEIKQNGAWSTPKDSSGNEVRGTVIGQRQLWQLSTTTADAIALVVDSARGVPAISEFGAYHP
ncbi:MAG: alpha-L-fucosidase [Polyangia bacterium]